MSVIPEPLVRVIRGPMIESIHYGHVAATDRYGRIVSSAGNPETPIFIRSTAKPLQAIAVVTSGAANRYGFEDRELALVCASHNGERLHVEAAAKLLERIGLDESCLRCGAHAPYHRPTAERMKIEGIEATSLHNNCSGKHSGMLAVAKNAGWPLDTYLSPEHPVQRMMLSTVAELTAFPEERIQIGVDGCGVPVFGMPLRNLAYGYARLATGEGVSEDRSKAARQVVDAMTAYPEYVAGDDRYDTKLMRATGGRIIGKMGAEGVFAAADRERGLGLAVKIADGSLRGLYVAVTEALRQLGALSVAEMNALAEYVGPDLTNHAGTEIGRIEPAFRLR